MTGSGYTDERADWHDKVAVPTVVKFLEERHHQVEEQEVDGHMPDLLVDRISWLDVKTRMRRNCHTGNFTVEVESAQTYDTLERVFLAFICECDPSIIRIEHWNDVRSRLGPPRPARESNDDWHLVPMTMETK